MTSPHFGTPVNTPVLPVSLPAWSAVTTTYCGPRFSAAPPHPGDSYAPIGCTHDTGFDAVSAPHPATTTTRPKGTSERRTGGRIGSHRACVRRRHARAGATDRGPRATARRQRPRDPRHGTHPRLSSNRSHLDGGSAAAARPLEPAR